VPDGGAEPPAIMRKACARRSNGRYSWPTWSGAIEKHRYPSPLADRCLNIHGFVVVSRIIIAGFEDLEALDLR